MINKRIMITGGAGFIGTKLVERLYKCNNILIYDNFHRNSLENSDSNIKDKIRIEKGDILDVKHLKSVVRDFKPEIIVHMAAIAGIGTVIKNPLQTLKVNIQGTFNILEAITECKIPVERFIDFSTSEIFGSYAYKVNEKNSATLQPVGDARWTYSVSKICTEHITDSYGKMFGLNTVTIRPFNIYGPGQVGEGAIHQFVTRAIRNEVLEIHGDGDQIRSWCYIDDFIDALILCLTNELAIGESFNIGNPKGTITIGLLATMIKEVAKSSSEIINVPKNYEDVELRIPSVEKSVKILGFNPKYDLIRGLERTIEWYKNTDVKG